jgi:hypothetical protein
MTSIVEHQIQDSTDAAEAQVLLSDWEHAEIIQSGTDTFRYSKMLVDRPWRVLTLWMFTNELVPTFTVDVTLDYIPALEDGDDWDQAYIPGGTQLFDAANLGTMKARRLAWPVAGIEVGKLLGVRFTFNNWVDT